MAHHDLTLTPQLGPPAGRCELVFDREHLTTVVRDAMLRATSSLEISTADFKAMLVPASSQDRAAPGGRAPDPAGATGRGGAGDAQRRAVGPGADLSLIHI